MAVDVTQEAFSARGFSRAYHCDLSAVLAAIHTEDGASRLVAYRRGKRRYTILRKDGEDWIRRNAVNPSDRTHERVEEGVAQESKGRM